ncbi:unnamed protein product [Chondrus crispus]|uniref:Uncharacterized protein n=1 Tax=Chondrus crispus TaxID=2769 RepID=R7QI14_CHOCR|nr:unnamed protein product [Chondrus crispus]CDF37403.1 unnamed protein product [Chondrus crispus]|eukprot:XP_005717222.1 unnamed protein product [Chondrus crispus]
MTSYRQIRSSMFSEHLRKRCALAVSQDLLCNFKMVFTSIYCYTYCVHIRLKNY